MIWSNPILSIHDFFWTINLSWDYDRVPVVIIQGEKEKIWPHKIIIQTKFIFIY